MWRFNHRSSMERRFRRPRKVLEWWPGILDNLVRVLNRARLVWNVCVTFGQAVQTTAPLGSVAVVAASLVWSLNDLLKVMDLDSYLCVRFAVVATSDYNVELVVSFSVGLTSRKLTSTAFAIGSLVSVDFREWCKWIYLCSGLSIWAASISALSTLKS